MSYLLFAVTDEIMPMLIPLPSVRNAWNQFIIPLAIAKPMVLHGLVSTRWCFSQNASLKEGQISLYRNKAAAIHLLNQNLNFIHNVSGKTLETMITTTVLLAGQEVRYS